MASKYKLGLVNIELGDIESDGGMALSTSPVGNTVEGSATLTTEEGQKTDFKIEESDSPVLSITTEADVVTLSWSTYDCDAQQLKRLFGGDVIPATSGEGEKWEAPDVFPEIEQSVKVTWKTGGTMLIPRAKIKGTFNMSFNRASLSQIDITATVLQPTKLGEKRMTIIDALS